MFALSHSHDTPYGSFAARLPYGVHWAPSVHRLRSKGFATVFEVEGYDAIVTEKDDAKNRTIGLRESMDRLGNRWFFEAHTVRREVFAYPETPVSGNRTLHLIDNEQREQFSKKGTFFRTRTFIGLVRRPETTAAKTIERLILGGKGSDEGLSDDSELEAFEAGVRDFGGALRNAYRAVRRLGSEVVEDELGAPYVLDYIAGLADSLIAGSDGPLAFQIDHPPLVNGVIGGVDVISGDFPEVNGWFHACITIDGFPPWSIAGIGDFLDQLPVESRRWSRFRPVSKSAALFRINQRRLGALGRAGTSEKDANPLALTTARAITQAYGLASEAGVSYGWYGGGIVLRSRDISTLEKSANDVVELLRNRKNFSARLERRISFRALLSSYLFNEGVETRPCFISSWNTAHLFPLSSVWQGFNVHPSPKFAKLGITRPTRPVVGVGNTPLNLSPWFEDVGDRALVGPKGAGKTTAIKGLIIGELLGSPRQLVVQFDSSYSCYILNRALGGVHIDLTGERMMPMICPAARIHEGDYYKDRFVAWCEDSFQLALKRQLSGDEVMDLKLGVEEFAAVPLGERSLSVLRLKVKEKGLFDAIDFFAVDRSGAGLLDAGESKLPSRESLLASGAQLVTIEIGALAGSPAKLIPTLMALFDWIEWSLNGDPIDVVADEVHKLFKEGRYAARFDRFARELRKYNGWLTTASQYASDYVAKDEGGSDLGALLGPATRNWFWLANNDPNERGIEEFLTPCERDVRSHLMPKRQYLFKNPYGVMPFSFEFGPIEGAIIFPEGPSEISSFREIENIVRANNRAEGHAEGSGSYKDLSVPMWFKAVNLPNWSDVGARWIEGDPRWGPGAKPVQPRIPVEAHQ